MKGKKFEWNTYEDTMENVLVYSTRVMDFLKRSNIKIFYMHSETEICNFGHNYDDYKTETSYNSSGHIYFDEEDQVQLETFIKDNFLLINPNFPDRIDVFFRRGRFTDAEKDYWNSCWGYDIIGNTTIHFEKSVEDIPLSEYGKMGICRFESLNGEKSFEVMQILINENGEFVHSSTNEVVRPVYK